MYVGENGVCTLVDKPRRSKSIGAKWVLKAMLKVDGIVECYKDCLVAYVYT